MNESGATESLQDTQALMDMPAPSTAEKRPAKSRAYGKLLGLVFVATLPLVNPWVRGDGVGYYAFLRAPLIEHDLNFEKDYRSANESFFMNRLDVQGRPLPDMYTRTGHLENHFTVGPALLWSPVLVPVHAAVLLAARLGARISPDGYSRPYLLAMAMTTALYGFLAILLSFQVAQKYFEPRWAVSAAVAIWLASSLPVYMYFNPSWSHAQSAFAVGLFLWYWDRTKMRRTTAQWALLALAAGLMGNVYYPNALLLIFPALEVLHALRERTQQTLGTQIPSAKLLLQTGLFLAVFLVSLAPTFITRVVVYGGPLETGYPPISTWAWTSPRLGQVLFSSDHGMFSWTPILLIAVAGLPFLVKRNPLLGMGAVLTFLAFWYFIAAYPNWDGISSYGNRFFVSLTPVFVLGLAALLSAISDWLGSAERAFRLAIPALGLLVVWNMAFIFQWGTHLVPARGSISWPAMVHNQFVAVPERLTGTLETYFLNRSRLMQRIEQEDVQQQKQQEPQGE